MSGFRPPFRVVRSSAAGMVSVRNCYEVVDRDDRVVAYDLFEEDAEVICRARNR